MKVYTIPVLSTNYAYLLVDPRTLVCAAVDPATPEAVLQQAQAHGLQLKMVLTTHHHSDHSGGNVALASLRPGLAIVGAKGGNVPGATQLLDDGERLELGSITITCINTPYHTTSHACYLCTASSGDPILFTGDALFLGGSGRCFTGDFSLMAASLERLADLDPHARVYPGHEYAVDNLQFCLAHEPENEAAQQKLRHAVARRAEGKPAGPSTLREERAYNVFLRTRERALQDACGCPGDPMATLRSLRRRKDCWGGRARALTAALCVAGWVGWSPK